MVTSDDQRSDEFKKILQLAEDQYDGDLNKLVQALKRQSVKEANQVESTNVPLESNEMIIKTFKIIILGDGGVGKTSLRRRFFGEEFNSKYLMTLGADFSVKRMEIEEIVYVLQFLDLAGQQRFADVRKSYYKHVSGAVLVFDITRPETFINIPDWLREFNQNQSKDVRNIPLILVGNKLDLRGDPIFHNLVTSADALKYTEELNSWSYHDIPYFETSALMNLNVDVAFRSLIHNIENSLTPKPEYHGP